MPLTADTLINEAVSSTGLDDFGGTAWKEGLQVFIRSLNTDLVLPDPALAHFRQIIIQTMVNRLEVTALINAQPEILAEKITAPIIITGLPRTGTSLLHALLSLDPRARFLRNWESCLNICPAPELIRSEADPRKQTYDRAMQGFFQAAPHLSGINGINFMAGSPAEYQNLMMHEFIHFGHCAGTSLWSYGEWIATCDFTRAYAWHKQLLQLLQWKLPSERWVLKAPMHLFGLDLLIKTYPDAKIVFTHRDPVKALASGASMVYHWTRFSTGQADPARIGPWWTRLWAKAMDHALAVRADNAPDMFCDIHLEETAQNPIAAVRKIYTHFSLDLDQAHEKRMQTWLRHNPRSRFGSHRPAPGLFNLNTQEIRKKFAA